MLRQALLVAFVASLASANTAGYSTELSFEQKEEALYSPPAQEASAQLSWYDASIGRFLQGDFPLLGGAAPLNAEQTCGEWVQHRYNCTEDACDDLVAGECWDERLGLRAVLHQSRGQDKRPRLRQGY